MDEKNEMIIEGIRIKPFDRTARGSFKEIKRASNILKTGDVDELYSLMSEILMQSGASVEQAMIALDSISVADIERIIAMRYTTKMSPLEAQPTTTIGQDLS